MKIFRTVLSVVLVAAALTACAAPTPTEPRAAPPNHARADETQATSTIKSEPLTPLPQDTTTRKPGQTFGSGT